MLFKRSDKQDRNKPAPKATKEDASSVNVAKERLEALIKNKSNSSCKAQSDEHIELSKDSCDKSTLSVSDRLKAIFKDSPRKAKDQAKTQDQARSCAASCNESPEPSKAKEPDAPKEQDIVQEPEQCKAPEPVNEPDFIKEVGGRNEPKACNEAEACKEAYLVKEKGLGAGANKSNLQEQGDMVDHSLKSEDDSKRSDSSSDNNGFYAPVVVYTIEELDKAQKERAERIIVKGELASKLKVAFKGLRSLGAGSLNALALCLSGAALLAPFTGGVSLGAAGTAMGTLGAAMTATAIAAISAIGFALVIAVFKGYDEVKLGGGGFELVIKKHKDKDPSES